MEEYLTKPLPTLSDAQEEGLPIDYDQKTLESAFARVGTLTSPANGDDSVTIIHWQAAHLLSKINADVLKGLLSRLPGASSKIGEIPMIKSYMNLLLLLTEEDSGKQWITRIPYSQEDRRFLIDQVEPLLRVRQRFTGFRVPKLYQYGLARDENNKLLVDYMLLDFIDGEQMPMWTETYPAWQQKEQILDQIADIYIQIFSKPVSYDDRLELCNVNCVDLTDSEDDDAFDLPPTMTTSLYLHHQVDKAIRSIFQRLLASNGTDVAKSRHLPMAHRLANLLTLFLMRSIIPTQVIGKYNDAPFYITHPDLHNRNIIIDSKPVPDEQSRSLHTRESESSNPVPLPPISRRRAMSAPLDQARVKPIKITGIVDWDAAHPTPLQCAAIYPKFLETLPGAEFPDLPSGHKAPDLKLEKDLFVEIFSRKELATTGDQVVTDLIRHGSWEHDFFTIALSRGEVRNKWVEHWRSQHARNVHVYPENQYEFSPGDIEHLWNGLRGFLHHEKNRRAVTRWQGWELVTRIVLQLEEFEKTAVERVFITSGQSCG